MMKNRRLPILLIAVLALVLLVLSQCQQPSPEPEQDEFPEPRPLEDVTPLPRGAPRPEVRLEAEQDLVSNQIVVTGGQEDIRRIIGEPETLGLRAVVTTSFDYLDEVPRPDEGDIDIRQQTADKRLRASDPLTGRLQDVASLRIVLYEITRETLSVSDVLQTIAERVSESEAPMDIGLVAEPNYVTGFEITGSPWGIEGSPWGIEGSPGPGTTPSSGVTYASDTFWQQWALQKLPGINLFDGSGAPLDGRMVDADGEGVQVAVFDTSPFGSEGGRSFDGWGPARFDPLQINVSHPITLPTSTVTSSTTITLTDISDHGLFVSGLVYAVAPASDIHLIRVLNDHGQGEVQGLLDAMNIYMRQRLLDEGTLENTVINLSLGAAEPDLTELPEEGRDAIILMLKSWGYTEPFPDPLPILGLDVMMSIASTYGATIVAASGNDSAGVSPPLPSHLPAAFDTVVGVAASSMDGPPVQSCYSNDGYLMAPGGNGGNGDANGDGIEDAAPASGQPACVPTHMTCASSGPGCPHAMVSYAYKVVRGFAHWVGTSFATPIVSGLAADVIQAHGASLPDNVKATLLCSAQTTGVVDAVLALDGSCP